MKTLLRAAIILALLFCTTSLSAQNPKNEHRRTISKTVPVVVKAISIDHQYGSLVINEWDRNEISIKAEIVVGSPNSQNLEKMSQCINVEVLPNMGDGTRIKTVIDHDKLSQLSKKKANFSINISINAPRSLATTLNSRYAQAEINAPIKSLLCDIKYGNLEVKQIEGNAKVNAKYGNVSIDKSGNVNLEIKYGIAKMGTIGNYNGSVSYGSTEIEKAVSVRFSEIGYSSCKIGNFENSLNVESLRYGSLVATAADSFTSVDVDASYSPVKLLFSGDVTFNCDITSYYGGVQFNIGYNGRNPQDNRHVGVCGKNYKEYFGKQTGKNVTVENRYSNVAIVKK